MDVFLSQTQSGFRPGRSTADAVWTHRWFVASIQRYREVIEVLGIGLSRALDTIKWKRFMEVIESFLSTDDLRLIRLLLSNIALAVQLSATATEPFPTTIGTPQGGSLSPVLFVIYLEAALHVVRAAAPSRCPEDSNLPFEIAYADDVDFVSL